MSRNVSFRELLRRVWKRLRPRGRAVLLVVFLVVIAIVALAPLAHADTIDPSGIGDLMPSPDIKVPPGHETLYEKYGNPMNWQLDTDYSNSIFNLSDTRDQALEWIADTCMGLIVDVGKLTVTLVGWLFNMVSLPPLEDAITQAIGGASKGLAETLLPAALAAGGVVAFAQNKRAGGSAISQIGWVFAAGVLSVSLLTSPQTWVSGIDSARQIGATVAMNATASGIGDGADFPIPMDHQAVYSNNARDTMLRKSNDAVWRSYVAAPWCVAEFGSLEACRRYGKGLLDQDSDLDKRKKWLKRTVTSTAVGDASVGWVKGKNPLGRIMVTVLALVSIVIFAVLVLTLAFSSLASLLGALMLLASGVLFACLWVIPGRPRQWGTRWFDQLCGMVLQSMVSTLVLGCVLIVNAATTEMFSTYGWLGAAGLSIAAAATAFHFRKVVESIIGVSGGASPGAAVFGLLAARGASHVAGRAVRASRKWSLSRSGPLKSRNSERSSSQNEEKAPARPVVATRSIRPPRPLPPSSDGSSTAADDVGSSGTGGQPSARSRTGSRPSRPRSRDGARSPETAVGRRPDRRPPVGGSPQPTATVPAARPSPTLRPESGASGFAFRDAPPARGDAPAREPRRPPTPRPTGGTTSARPAPPRPGARSGRGRREERRDG